jgi:hypothetical protein
MEKVEGTPYKDMSPSRKALFVFKVVICVITLGLVFPNVMSSD